MSKTESPGTRTRKLKQAQLPFVGVNETSPGIIKKAKKVFPNDPKDKENISSQGKPFKKKSKNFKKSVEYSEEILVVDLTENDSCHGLDGEEDERASSSHSLSTIQNIEKTIDFVVRRYSSEFVVQADGNLTQKEIAVAKKRRRRSRSWSPVPPEAKRAILCDSNDQHSVTMSSEDTWTKKNSTSTREEDPPTIIITAPTPIRNKVRVMKGNVETHKKPRRTFFDDILIHVQNDESVEIVKKSAETSHEKPNTKYPPLSSILGKKRSRSKSPTGSRNQKDVRKSAEKDAESTSSSPAVGQSKVKSKEGSKDDRIQSSSMAALIKSKNMVTTIFKKPQQDLNKSPKNNQAKSSSLIKIATEVIESERDQNEQTLITSPAKPQNFIIEVIPPSPVQKSSTDAEVTPPKSGTKVRRSLEAQRKREEKEKEKEEKRKQREEEKLAREKEKQEAKRKIEEKKAQKEEERKKKKEEEEAAKSERQRKLEEKKREKEKLETEKKLERETKEEDRRKEKERKEEEKRQKEVEKQMMEKEKQNAEEEKKRKDEKRVETFKSFFKSPSRSPSVKKVTEHAGIFAPFQLKQDMLLAPLNRARITPAQKKAFDEDVQNQDFSSVYLEEISCRPKHMYGPTIPRLKRKFVSLADDGLELIDDDTNSKPGVKMFRAKFLSFHVNYRPPYYGTWRKESKVLSYKNPFKKDSDVFDYEFDSDDEWEEPGEGEDIANSDEEGEEGDGNEEDVDDGFFVPHGYLSDDEGINEDGDEDGLKPDHKLKRKQLEFEASFKRKLSTLTPIVIGCVWKDSSESLEKAHKDILDSYKPEFLSPTPIEIFPRSKSPANDGEISADCLRSDQAKKPYGLKAVPEEAVPDLIRLLHGNALALPRIVKEFRAYWKIKKSSTEPLTVGPMPLEEVSLDEETETMDTEPESIRISPAKAEGTTVVAKSPAKEEAVKTIIVTAKNKDNAHVISKTQIMKKCKEISSYTKRDNMNRSCWFVHDSVLEQFAMDKGNAPVPCKWNFVTEVPNKQILIYPQPLTKSTAAATEHVTTTPKRNPGQSISKFVAKLSPNVILEQSKLKRDKEKQAAVMPPSISKFTTDKISPNAIIEKSARKITEDQTKLKQVQEREALSVAKNAPSSQQQEGAGTYMIPTHDAARSFFRIDEKGVVDLTSQDSNA